MDYTRTLTILTVNGYSTESSPEEIGACLKKANYTDADVADFLKEVESHRAGAIAAGTVPQTVTQPSSFTSQPVVATPIADPLAPPPSVNTKPLLIGIAIVLLILVGAGGYVAYAMFGMTPTQSVLMSMKESALDKKFHLDVDVHNTAAALDGQVKFTMGADVDTTDPNMIKLSATPSLHSSLFSGDLDVLAFGKTYYTKINSLSILGMQVSSTTGIWYKITPDEIARFVGSSASVAQTDQLLAAANPEAAKKRAEDFFNSGTLEPAGAPKLTLQNGKPVLLYTFAVNADKLAAWKASNNPTATTTTRYIKKNTEVAYSPVLIAKDFFTGRLVSVDGGVSSTFTNPFTSKKQTTGYVFHVGYSPASSVVITEPATSTPAASLSTPHSSTTSAARVPSLKQTNPLR